MIAPGSYSFGFTKIIRVHDGYDGNRLSEYDCGCAAYASEFKEREWGVVRILIPDGAMATASPIRYALVLLPRRWRSPYLSGE